MPSEKSDNDEGADTKQRIGFNHADTTANIETVDRTGRDEQMVQRFKHYVPTCFTKRSVG